MNSATMRTEFPDLQKNLGNLIEEASEVIQAARKCDRFGMYNYNPMSLDKRLNFEQLEAEIGDLLATVKILIACNKLSKRRIDEAEVKKLVKLRKFYNVEKRDEPNQA